MTVIFSKKCEYGMQAVLYLAAQDVGTIIPAEQISRVLKIPKEFISKILQSLRESGIICSTKGKSGGFCLAKPSSEIKLIDVVDEWGALRTQALEMLTSETLDKLKDRTLKKILTL